MVVVEEVYWMGGDWCLDCSVVLVVYLIKTSQSVLLTILYDQEIVLKRACSWMSLSLVITLPFLVDVWYYFFQALFLV